MDLTRIILLSLCLLFGPIIAQQQRIDSLQNVLDHAQHDTTRTMARFNLGEASHIYRMDFWDSLRLHCEKKAAEVNSEKLKRKREYVLYSSLMAGAMANMAYVMQRNGNYERSLELHSKSLRLREQINDMEGQANSLYNIAQIYETQGDITVSEKYLLRALELGRKINSPFIEAAILNSLSHLLLGKGNLEGALEYLEKAAKIRKDIHDISGLADTYYSLGKLYLKKGDTKKALATYMASAEMNEQVKDEGSLAAILCHIGKIHLAQKDLGKAFQCFERSVEISKRLGFPELIRNSAGMMCKAYKASGNSRKALEYYELYIQYRDSIENTANRKAVIKNQLRYEYEKQAAADSVAHAKESEIKNAELAKQTAEIKAKKNQQYALFGGLFCVCVFGVFMYNRFKVTQRQKTIIEHQKAEVEKQKILVEQKQKEVLDSIQYAKRIQLAQMPTEKRVASLLKRTLR